MRPGFLNIALKSVSYHRKQVLYQVLIIALLSAVITGSLMTGRSVRSSLKSTAVQKLGNTGFLISSGTRYFAPDLVNKFSRVAAMSSTGLLEMRGSTQGLTSQRSSNNTVIYAIGDDFFKFHNVEIPGIERGTVIVNTKLANALDVKAGDDVIVRFKSISDIPADAPFAPSADEASSIVLKVGRIADAGMMGNFSLTISQVTSSNLFMNLADLQNLTGKKPKINRLLTGRNIDAGETAVILKKVIELSDAGLHIREVRKTGECEIISDRVFIDDLLIQEIRKKFPSASPLITYLANRIEKGEKTNPYSFVSAIPEDLYPEAPSGNGIIINSWLAEDIGAHAGDTVHMSWYAPDSLNHLVEKDGRFRVEGVTSMEGIGADSLLMPDFPGIARSESCSAWDAGIPIKTNLIRNKDEDYWRRFKGTPKAFLNYETGKKLWGSNYGPATAIRFPSGLTAGEINESLSGSLDPEMLGFTISDIYGESLKAAEESVDFGTLFLSLGFFLILASFVLLSFAVSYYFEIRKNEVKVYYSLGYRNRTISNLLMYETSFTAFTGCLAGSFAGFMVNVILITALNSVWTGAVQTNTLAPAFDAASLLTGFAATLLLTLIFMYFKVRSYLKSLRYSGIRQQKTHDSRWNGLPPVLAFSLTIILVVLSFNSGERITISFVAGAMLLITMILFWRWFYIKGRKKGKNLSRLYYARHTSHAVTPVLFIAAGIFAVFITAVNRKNFNVEMNDPSSGTGGYLLWMETSIPVTDDLNSVRGRVSLGLDDDSLSTMRIVEMKRSAGNDASCLNLNHITAPPLLAVDPETFSSRNAFSFTKTIRNQYAGNPWNLLAEDAGEDAIYGIADQTVLDWGLKIGVGDTLVLRAESGRPLKIIIAAGLQSSVFQGFVVTGKKKFDRYYPSVSGNSVFLADGEKEKPEMYRNVLQERLSAFGPDIEYTSDRLAAFYEITNTYLSVFGVFGGLGMITGIAGLGFVLLRNYSRRKREFALMLAVGFAPSAIRKMIFSEQALILSAGILSGVIPAIIATLPSLGSNHEIPWLYLIVIILTIFITGLDAAMISLRSIKEDNLIGVLRKE